MLMMADVDDGCGDDSDYDDDYDHDSDDDKNCYCSVYEIFLVVNKLLWFLIYFTI